MIEQCFRSFDWRKCLLTALLFGGAAYGVWASGLSPDGVSAASVRGSEVSESREVITIGILDTLNMLGDDESIAETIDHLQKSIPGYRLRTQVIVAAEARETIPLTRPDFVFAPSGLSYELLQTSSVVPLHIATRKVNLAKTAARSVGAVFVVSKARTDLQTINDLKGKTVAADLPNSLSGWLAAQGELAARGFDPDSFYKKVKFLSNAYPNVLSTLLSGHVDVAVLPTCVLETAEEMGLIAPGALRVVEAKNDDELACRHSTQLYPDVTLLAFDWTQEKVVREVTLSLLSSPPRLGYEWLSTAPSRHVLELYKALETGPYAYLKERSLSALYRRWQTQIHAALIVLMLLFFNEVRVHWLVKRRTAQLTHALDVRKALEKEAGETRRRLSHLEQRSIVTQMSGMIAHEIRSPVGAIRNFAAVLKLLLKGSLDETPNARTALNGIDKEAQRIGGIVDRVRAYAKQQHAQHAPCDLVDCVKKAIHALDMTLPEHVPVAVSFIARAPVLGDALELELLALNLIKNAAQALEGVKEGRVFVSVTPSGEERVFTLTVEDNGAALSEEAFARLHSLSESIKPEGLGLGLTIVRGIADSHGGVLTFSQRSPNGIRAVFQIDCFEQGDLP